MKLEEPINKNYCATVVRIHNTIPLENCDNVVGASIFGFQVIVSKDTEPLGVFFPCETELSDEYCYENNLYREDSRTGNLNKDKTSKGYIQKNRRIRAIKFRSMHTSNGLFMPLSSLAWTGVDVNELKEGDEFDILNGKLICKKYVIQTKTHKERQTVDRGFVRADKKFMPEHIDTENFFKNHDKIDPNTEVYITQKLHGTSIRIGNTYVNYKPKLIDRIARFFGAKIIEIEHTNLYGSRKVIKDANNPNQNHFYDTDIWTNEGRKLDSIIPENYILYGELIGWTSDGKPLQKGYTYGIKQGLCELYVYRITIINSKGLMTDLSWEQVKEFCIKNDIKFVPELAKCKMMDLTKDEFSGIRFYLDKRYHDGDMLNYRNAVWLGENKDVVDEGVCVRADGLIPKILKAKSPKFLEHETNMLDTGEEDLESSQTI